MKVRWSETALAEIDEIFSYIYEYSRSAASAVVDRIEDLTTLLEQFPHAGHLTDEPDVRVLSVIRYPYLIFYNVDLVTDEVVILHVRHGRREQP
jgi:plasmid stabilization system protein ParE